MSCTLVYLEKNKVPCSSFNSVKHFSLCLMTALKWIPVLYLLFPGKSSIKCTPPWCFFPSFTMWASEGHFFKFKKKKKKTDCKEYLLWNKRVQRKQFKLFYFKLLNLKHFFSATWSDLLPKQEIGNLSLMQSYLKMPTDISELSKNSSCSGLYLNFSSVSHYLS